jgi:SAM-dependent methyltransferase
LYLLASLSSILSLRPVLGTCTGPARVASCRRGKVYDGNSMEGMGMERSSRSEGYVLRGGRAGAERLRLLNRVKWPTTQPLLRAAGLRAGMSCLDVGCGSGDVTLKMAALVGAEGNVVGVDRDQSILQLASQEAERQGLPVTFRRLDTEELAEESAYDLVFARYLLSHLPRPQRAVELMVRAVRPGGRLVLEDVFFPGHICYPANAAFDRYLELYQAVASTK